MFLEHGFGPYNVGDIVSEYTRRSVGRVSPSIIRLFVENSGEMMDNLVALTPDTSNAFDFDDDQCIIQVAYGDPSDDAYPMELSGYKTWPATFQTQGTVSNTQLIEGREEMSRITELETYCMREAQRLGAVWYRQHSAVALQLDGDAVLGAYAKGPDGKYLKLNAKKAVLLSSGDFSSNADMVYNLLDDVAEWSTRAGADRSALTGMGRDGAGHKLGCWAGGAIEPHPRPSMNTMGGMPGPWGTCPMLTLNAKGKRFMNEAMSQVVNANCMRQPLGKHPDHRRCRLSEDRAVRHFGSRCAELGLSFDGADHGGCDLRHEARSRRCRHSAVRHREEGGGSEHGRHRRGGHVRSRREYRRGSFGRRDEAAGTGPMEGVGPMGDGGPNLWCANTIEELLGYLGMEGEALETALAEIERYNELCHAGADTDFGKDASVMFPVEKAPFYGSVSETPASPTQAS